MNDKPWGISPVAMKHMAGLKTYADTWYWCRRHECASKAGKSCTADAIVTYEFPLTDCVRVGPFMSEREANRLAGYSRNGHRCEPATLGMEVER